jgi:outer membrane protein assembly factor BamE (lipoprotein component of BamABCDE complex)
MAVASSLAACTPIVDARGHGTDPEDFKQVVIGQSRDEDVQALLGSPSARSTYGEQTWYYITLRRETVGAYAPMVADQHVTAIRFDANHVVTAIEDRSKQDAQAAQIIEQATPTEGTHDSVIGQMLGNIGRFGGAPSRTVDPRR